jgi:hypothetical protein
MENMVPFTAKASRVKTRTIEGKDYFVYRVNMPKEITDELGISEKDEYLFFKTMKAQWYHMLEWKEMPKTWEKLPEPVRKEIQDSGLYSPNQNVQPYVQPNLEVGWTAILGSCSVWQSQTGAPERRNYCTPSIYAGS